jgi:hypothetical protein
VLWIGRVDKGLWYGMVMLDSLNTSVMQSLNNCGHGYAIEQLTSGMRSRAFPRSFPMSELG